MTEQRLKRRRQRRQKQSDLEAENTRLKKIIARDRRKAERPGKAE